MTGSRRCARSSREISTTRSVGCADRQPTILIAEDVPLNLKLITALVDRLVFDARILHAENGGVAVRLAQEHDVDVVLMDGQMPDVDGLEAAERIRAFEEAWGRSSRSVEPRRPTTVRLAPFTVHRSPTMPVG